MIIEVNGVNEVSGLTALKLPPRATLFTPTIPTDTYICIHFARSDNFDNFNNFERSDNFYEL